MLDLLQHLDEPFTAERLFDELPDIVYFVKDAEARYSVVNRTLVERCGLGEKSELVGRTASELLRRPYGDRFEAQDRQILRTGEPLRRRLELHIYEGLAAGWGLTTKLPLLRGGHVVGIVGVTQDLRLPNKDDHDYEVLSQATGYVERHLDDAPTVADMARATGLSRYQLDKRMRRVYGITAGQWLLKLRIDLAQERLATTDLPVAAVAHDVGYSDQSAFTRQFRHSTGLSPSEFRKRHARRAGADG